MEEEARNEIKAELESERASLCHGDRRLLKCFYGLIGLDGVRKATLKKKELCTFVRKTLYGTDENGTYPPNVNHFERKTKDDGKEKEQEAESDFNVELELDPRILNFPSIFDNGGIKDFLAHAGLTLNQRERAGILKSFQVLMKSKFTDNKPQAPAE